MKDQWYEHPSLRDAPFEEACQRDELRQHEKV